MIKVQIGDALFYCDTPREAADIAAMMKQNQPKQPKAHKESRVFTEGKDDMDIFINTIRKLPHTTVSSADLAGALGVAIQGLGPKIRGVSKRFQDAYREPLENVLVREGRPGQPSVWKVNKDALEKLYILG